MKQLGRIAALAGFAIAAFLVWREHPETTWRLMRDAGFGLVLAACVHVMPMWANAWDWRTLIRPAERPSLLTMLKIVWIRESVNGLLPVARVGGEIVSFRLLNRLGVRPASALGSLVVDIQLTLISQLLFAFLACAYVLDQSNSGAAHTISTLLWSISAAVPVLVLFALVQHARPFERMARVMNQVTSGKLVELVGKSVRIDQAVKLIWRRKATVLRYLFIWQTIQFIGFSLEIWLALRVLGAEPTFAQACVIEALIQIVSSIAFLVPASLGVQEGGFVLIGAIFGFDAPTCLALAGARRIRDLLFYVPGLIAWQLAEYGGPRERQTQAKLDHGA